ncbi:unnamed protein product [Effrenium voratum]|nr:unnamed protein product [Effrenium voratum]
MPLQLIAVLGLGAFAVATMTASRPGGAHVCFLSFLVFEFCVGVYFPSIGTLKSELVPERIRATMYNICRVPLNAVVVSLLLTDLTVIQCFRFCALLMGAVFVAGFGIRKSYCESVPEDSVKAK